MAIRKWNEVGGRQLAVLQWINSSPRTSQYIFERLGRSHHGGVLPSLLARELVYKIDDLFYLTDHGKAILLPPDDYQQWKKDWGKA